MGIAALVLGIIGLLVSLVPLLGVLAFPLAILALIFGGLAIRAKVNKGLGIAGFVTGLLAFGFAFIQHSNNKKIAGDLTKLGADLKEGVKKKEPKLIDPSALLRRAAIGPSQHRLRSLMNVWLTSYCCGHLTRPVVGSTGHCGTRLKPGAGPKQSSPS